MAADAKNTGDAFTFVGCSYVVRAPRKGQKLPVPWALIEKPLLCEVSASCASGEVLALMGPSGAGKTTLLNLLTLERGSGTPSGTLTLNGHAFTLDVFRKHAAIVNQTDQLWAFLTAREHLEYATALYQPSVTASERRASVDRLLADTGLEVC